MKKSLCILLIFLILFSLASCGYKQPESISAGDVKAVTATTSAYSSYLYVIEDGRVIAELVELYNGLRYEPICDGEDPNILGGTLYMLSFVSEYEDGVIGDSVAQCWISPDGYVTLDGNIYHLTSDFNEEQFVSLLEEYNTFR